MRSENHWINRWGGAKGAHGIALLTRHKAPYKVVAFVHLIGVEQLSLFISTDFPSQQLWLMLLFLLSSSPFFNYINGLDTLFLLKNSKLYKINKHARDIGYRRKHLVWQQRAPRRLWAVSQGAQLPAANKTQTKPQLPPPHNRTHSQQAQGAPSPLHRSLFGAGNMS